MTNIKSLFWFSICLLSVQCFKIIKDSSDTFIVDSEDFVQSKLKRSTARADGRGIRNPVYNYNHPPHADDYASIPVAVIFDTGDNIAQKSIRPTTYKPLRSKDSTLKPPKENIDKVTNVKTLLNTGAENNTQKINLSVNYKVLSANDDVSINKDDLNSSNIDNPEAALTENNKSNTGRNRNNFEIPVAVVYDSDTEKPRHEFRREQNDKAKLRRKVSSNRIRANVNITKENTEENVTGIQVQVVRHEQITDEKNIINEKINAIRPTPATRVVTVRTVVKDVGESDEVKSRNASTGNFGKFEKRRSGEKDPVVPIVELENHLYSKGEFRYNYEGGDGTKAFETGELKTFDNEQAGEAVVGGFSYTDKEGNAFELTYTADENGYRPVGAHLPTPPPIPPAIARALAYLATKTTPEPVTEPNTTKKISS